MRKTVVALLLFAALGCNGKSPTEPMPFALPTATPTPAPSPTPSFVSDPCALPGQAPPAIDFSGIDCSTYQKVSNR